MSIAKAFSPLAEPVDLLSFTQNKRHPVGWRLFCQSISSITVSGGVSKSAGDITNFLINLKADA